MGRIVYIRVYIGAS